MSRYAQIRTAIKISEYSDLAGAELHAHYQDITAGEVMVLESLSCATGAGQTIDLTPFGTGATVHVVNTDDTNFVTVTYTTVADGVQTTVKLLAGEDILLRNVKTSSTFKIVADTAACNCNVIVLGT